jgi:hypothetical protein
MQRQYTAAAASSPPRIGTLYAVSYTAATYPTNQAPTTPPVTCSLVVPCSGTHESTSTRARADAQADSCQRSTARFWSHYVSRLDDSHRGSTALLNGLMDISSLPSLNRLIHLGLPSLQLHGMAAPSRQALREGQCDFAYRALSTSPFPGKRQRVGPYRWLIHRCQTGRGSQPHVRRLEQGVAAGAGTPHQSVTTSPCSWLGDSVPPATLRGSLSKL